MNFLTVVKEAYRSGYNELHSKCSDPKGSVGSNPTASAISTNISCFQGEATFHYTWYNNEK